MIADLYIPDRQPQSAGKSIIFALCQALPGENNSDNLFSARITLTKQALVKTSLAEQLGKLHSSAMISPLKSAPPANSRPSPATPRYAGKAQRSHLSDPVNDALKRPTLHSKFPATD
jgi:hypothetical protein